MVIDYDLFREELADKDPYDIATILLELLVQRRNDEADTSFLANFRRMDQTERIRQARMIEILIEELQQYGDDTKGLFRGLAKSAFNRRAHTYDVAESLLSSGFFCTLYWYMPNVEDPTTATKPIWEQVSLKRSNIKGQQYYHRNDFEEAVINYSEIWGQAVFLTAEGTFAPIGNVAEQPPNAQSEQPTATRNAVKRIVRNSRSLRTCPDVFQVDATKVTLHLFGIKLDLPIRGSSNLVILYADPRIRIFVSPLESKTAVGNWEEAGLVVAQVRSNLVLGDPVIDLR
ncbi:MAG: hypothetical protein SGILL_002346 [Bacillariaceae sp.]